MEYVVVILKCISYTLAVVGAILLVKDIKKQKIDLMTFVFCVLSLFGVLCSYYVEKEHEKEHKKEYHRIENLVDETRIRIMEELKSENHTELDEMIKSYLEKGELSAAIAAIDIHTNDKEAAQKHIRKAQLYTLNAQFSEAEQNYKQAVSISPSYDNNISMADFYYAQNRFPEATKYYSNSSSLANTSEEKALVSDKIKNVQNSNTFYQKAKASYNEVAGYFVSRNQDIQYPAHNNGAIDTQQQYQKNNSATINNNTQQYQKSNSATINNNTQQYQKSNSATINNNTQQYQKSNSAAVNNNTQQYQKRNSAIGNTTQRHHRSNSATGNNTIQQYQKSNSGADNNNTQQYQKSNSVTF